MTTAPEGYDPTTPEKALHTACPRCGLTPHAARADHQREPVESVRGWVDCPSCGVVSERPEDEEETDEDQARWCRKQDEHRGEPGGGSRTKAVKRRKKSKPDHTRRRVEMEPGGTGLIRHCPDQVTITNVEIRDNPFALYTSEYQRHRIESMATAQRHTLNRFVVECFAAWLAAGAPYVRVVPPDRVRRTELLLSANEKIMLKAQADHRKCKMSHVLVNAISYWHREFTAAEEFTPFLEG